MERDITKYLYDTKVKIIGGFYRGCQGVLIERRGVQKYYDEGITYSFKIRLNDGTEVEGVLLWDLEVL